MKMDFRDSEMIQSGIPRDCRSVLNQYCSVLLISMVSGLLSSGFADFGFLFGTNDLLGSGDILSSIGLGIRIRNDNLVFNTLQIRLGFYPNLPDLFKDKSPYSIRRTIAQTG